MSEENKEYRRKQANAIRIRASVVHMPLDAFQKKYQQRHVVTTRDEFERIERITGELFCNECVEVAAYGLITAHLLHATIEADPLKNFWRLCTVQCYGCGFNEIIALDKPMFTAEELECATKPGQFINTLRPAMINTAHDEIVADRNDSYSQEMVEQIQEREAKRMHAHTIAMQNAAMQAHQHKAQQYQQMKLQEHEQKLREAERRFGIVSPPPDDKTMFDRIAERVFRGK